MVSHCDRLQEIPRKFKIMSAIPNVQNVTCMIQYPYNQYSIVVPILMSWVLVITCFNKKLQKRQKTIEEQDKLNRQTSERKTSLRKTFGDSQREKKRDNAFAEVKKSVFFNPVRATMVLIDKHYKL